MEQEPVYDSNEFPEEERAKAIAPDDPAEDLHADPDAPEEEAPDILEGPVPPWRVAKALMHFRKQVNQLAPGRSKVSDGTIGDPAHQSRRSDHNPHIRDGGYGIVSALDITHDPRGGCDAAAIANSLLESRDPRIKYIIWNKRIAASYAVDGHAPWAWRSYSGRNPHQHHVHISVAAEKARFDAERDWAVQVV